MVVRCRVDSTDGVRAVGVCRLAPSCSNRDSLCTRERVDEEGFAGVTDGAVILERDRTFELTGDGVRGVNVLVWFAERFVDCLPIRVPMLRERDRPDDLDVFGEGVLPGVGVVLEGLEKVVGVRLCVGVRLGDGAGVEGRVIVGELRLFERVGRRRLGTDDRLWIKTRLRDGLVLGRDGLLTRGLADRLGIDRCGVGREIDREGVRLRVGREIDREGARLGVRAGRVAGLLLCGLA